MDNCLYCHIYTFTWSKWSKWYNFLFFLERRQESFTTLQKLCIKNNAMNTALFPPPFRRRNMKKVSTGAALLALALADRLYREREEKIKAQAESLMTEKSRNDAHNACF